jgi:hypothetical protein
VNHLIERVREYLKPRRRRWLPGDGVTPSDVKMARSLRSVVVSQLVTDVHIYVSELNRVLTGIESHAGALSRLRDGADRAVRELNSEYLRTGSDRLYWYGEAASQYIALLESHIAGEEASSPMTLNHAAIWYSTCRREAWAS